MTTAIRRRFGTAIRRQRIDLRISQEELADRAGLHRTYISDVERGTRNLSLESIGRLAKALKLSVSALFSRAGTGTGTGPDQLIEILLIEDNPHDAELTVRAFRKARMTNTVHVVPDGADALDFLFATGAHARRVHSALPGVILLDLNLPKVNGLEVLQRIKADERTRRIPVIVLTVSDRDRDITACRRLGAENYIVKPVGFSNFSKVMPYLQLDWALVRHADTGPE